MKCHEPAAFLVALLNAQPMAFTAPTSWCATPAAMASWCGPWTCAKARWAATSSCKPCSRTGCACHCPCRPSPGETTPLFSREGLTHPSRRCAWACTSSAACPAGHGPHRPGPGRGAPSKVRKTWPCAPRSRARRWCCWPRPTPPASLSGHRRQQVWEASAQRRRPGLLQEAPIHEAPLTLPEAPLGEAVVADLQRLGLSLKAHPQPAARGLAGQAADEQPAAASLPRPPLRPRGRAGDLAPAARDRQGHGLRRPGRRVRLRAGDRVKRVRDQYRLVLRESRLLAVYGQWQREGQVGHLIAGHLANLNELLAGLDGMDGPGMPTPQPRLPLSPWLLPLPARPQASPPATRSPSVHGQMACAPCTTAGVGTVPASPLAGLLPVRTLSRAGRRRLRRPDWRLRRHRHHGPPCSRAVAGTSLDRGSRRLLVTPHLEHREHAPISSELGRPSPIIMGQGVGQVAASACPPSRRRSRPWACSRE